MRMMILTSEYFHTSIYDEMMSSWKFFLRLPTELIGRATRRSLIGKPLNNRLTKLVFEFDSRTLHLRWTSFEKIPARSFWSCSEKPAELYSVKEEVLLVGS